MRDEWTKDVVAITGTIGSGKSTALSILESFGAKIISADSLAREVVLPGSPQLDEIIHEFGPTVLTEDGTLNRRRMAEIVFSDINKRQRLEAILHPAIKQLAKKKYLAAKSSGQSMILYEIPLLFETDLSKNDFKAIILIRADDAICMQRIITRDNISEKEARNRIEAQLPTKEKELLSDIIIDNSGSLEQLKDNLKKIYNNLA